MGSGASGKWIIDPLFGAYNLLCLLFGIGLLLFALGTPETNRRAIGLLGSVVLLFEGLFGFATLFFPEDPASSSITGIGITHIVLAGLSSLATIVAMLFTGLWLTADQKYKALSRYSFISVGIVFIFGGITAATGTMRSSIAGLLERVTIGGFIQWIFVIGLVLQSKSNSMEARTQNSR